MKKGDFGEFPVVWDQKERGFAEFAMVCDEVRRVNFPLLQFEKEI